MENKSSFVRPLVIDCRAMAMSEDLELSSAASFRRYSDCCLPKAAEGSNRVGDLVASNNHKNDQLNELSQMEAHQPGGDAGDDEDPDGDEKDDIDDDWLSKLAGSKDPARPDGAPCGLSCGEVPLLCEEELDFKERTMRTLRVGLRKIWRRGSATITAEDPTYKVAYLGNVLTGWAKGEGCVEKPLSTLWKNYNSSTKPDVQMKISVTQSGLKAVTKEHGLIEYWSHRITYCAVPPGLGRVFCWVYRHEGRKLKQELRCHAVLCAKESVAGRMAATLRLRLSQALLDFKRDKLLRQNARLSLANAVYENPSLPRRKLLLSTGSHNYKPPLERSKSAPKLMSIEESVEEEESTPKARRKGADREDDEDDANQQHDEPRDRKPKPEDKCDYKLGNLNFVKKLCSSIENLVESTSNYSKKLLSERKSGRECCVGSISSCCSDVSSLVTSSSLRSDEEEGVEGSGGQETSGERLEAYLMDCEEAGLEEEAKVILHPTGDRRGDVRGAREAPGEEDVASDESGYAELPESLSRTLSLDSKAKDLPYHKIIKSTMLTPGRTKPSCLHV